MILKSSDQLYTDGSTTELTAKSLEPHLQRFVCSRVVAETVYLKHEASEALCL